MVETNILQDTAQYIVAQKIDEKEKLVRRRTIKDCYKYIKDLDPNTCISLWFLRQLVKNSQINSFLSGRKRYVDLDSLLNYLGCKGA